MGSPLISDLYEQTRSHLIKQKRAGFSTFSGKSSPFYQKGSTDSIGLIFSGAPSTFLLTSTGKSVKVPRQKEVFSMKLFQGRIYGYSYRCRYTGNGDLTCPGTGPLSMRVDDTTRRSQPGPPRFCDANASQNWPCAAFSGTAMQSKRMGRDGPYAHKLHASQAFARFRGARLAHEVLCTNVLPW